MSSDRNYEREFVRTFFTSPTAVSGENSAKMLQSAAQLRGMQAPDTWIPDNEDATAPSMRAEGVQNLVEVVSEHGADFPGEIHPRVVWHRDDPSTRYEGFKQMLEITDPENGAVEHIDGFVIPEVGDLDDWKKADEFITIIENEHGLDEGSLSMSVIIESGEAELAMSDLRAEKGKPSNNLERLFLLVDGQVDYTKDMRAMTPTGELPAWAELRHNTSRGASAASLRNRVLLRLEDFLQNAPDDAVVGALPTDAELAAWLEQPTLDDVVEGAPSALPERSAEKELNGVDNEALDAAAETLRTAISYGSLVLQEYGMHVHVNHAESKNVCADCGATVHVLGAAFLSSSCSRCATCCRPRCLDCAGTAARAAATGANVKAACRRCKDVAKALRKEQKGRGA